MTTDDSILALLRLAPARRAAVEASYLQASRSNVVARIHSRWDCTRIDDLCRLLALADAFAASDAALACAAAEDNPALSIAARTIYGARLRLRAAGLASSAFGPNGKAIRAIRCANLRAALDAVLDSGYDAGCVPRRLLHGLGAFDFARPSGNDPVAVELARPMTTSIHGVHRRILAAAYSDDREKLVQMLSAPPYSIELENLRAALAQVGEGSARAALAAAVAKLRGSQARDAALAGLAALDAARPNAEKKDFSLTSVLESLGRAVALSPRPEDAQVPDPQLEILLRAATDADRIWSAEAELVDPAIRVSSLLDGLTHVRAANGLALIPYGCADPTQTFGISFEDAPSAPIAWESLAAALDIAVDAIGQPTDEGQLRVLVSAPLDRALVEYLFETERTENRRVWPAPEMPVAFAAPTMTFSASRLNAYVKCPRRWFYEYMCEALEDPSSLYATYGKVLHDALEALHREVRVPSLHDAGIILERLLRELDVAFGRTRPDFASQLEYEVSRCRARRMAEQYVRWLTGEAARAPLEIVGVELLARTRIGDHEFIGYIDRIDRPVGGGPVTIFDYKTGRIDSDAQEYLKKVRRGDEAQLALYYAMRRAEGDEIARIALVSIRDPRDDVWILALDIVGDDGVAVVEREAHDGVLRATCSRADLDASLAVLIQRCDMLTKRGLDHYEAGEDPPCNFCAYARACRERPIDGERIFAR